MQLYEENWSNEDIIEEIRIEKLIRNLKMSFQKDTSELREKRILWWY